MAIKIVKPVDTEFPMTPATVEGDPETEEEFTWVSLNCCAYTYYQTHIDDDFEEDIDV